MDNNISLVSSYHVNTGSRPPQKEASRTSYDFLTFLAVAQNAGLPLLDINWQLARAVVNLGGTSRVNEAIFSIQTSLVFKCVKDESKRAENLENVYFALINEIRVLTHLSMKQHPNIATLQGVCWDIPSTGEVWPALVFEKSRLGDLHHFSTGLLWRMLEARDRLKLCVDIGIIHSDIKPENVLVFMHGDSWLARVIDFGYSQIMAEDGLYTLAKSWPWQAPELALDGRRRTLSESKKTDVYSYAMLCFWVLFHPYFDRKLALPPHLSWVEDLLTGGDIFHVLYELKTQGKLSTLALELLSYLTLSNDEKNQLRNFFKLALRPDPDTRPENMQECFGMLLNPGATLDRLSLGLGDDEATKEIFNLPLSIEEFYEVDYRVREFLVDCLEAKLSHNCEPDIKEALERQLCLCYYLGFGRRKDNERVNKLSVEPSVNVWLQETISRLNDDSEKESWPALISSLRDHGSFSSGFFSVNHAEKSALDMAAAHLRLELADLQSAGYFPRLESTILFRLAQYYISLGDFQEAEKVQSREIELEEELSGVDSEHILASKANLIVIYRNLGRLQEAEASSLYVLGKMEDTIGPQNLQYLSVKGSLANIYMEQGRGMEGEQLQKENLETLMDIYGTDHPTTLRCMNNLSMTYKTQGRWIEAEELQVKVLEMIKNTLGRESISTATVMASLAVTYHNLKKLKEAEILQSEALEVRRKLLGSDHPHVVASLANMATIYLDQGKLGEAESHALCAAQGATRAFSSDHPFTLTSKTILGRIYYSQRRLLEAEDLQKQVLKIKKQKLGDKHRDTLVSMEHYAETLKEMGMEREAAEVLQ